MYLWYEFLKEQLLKCKAHDKVVNLIDPLKPPDTIIELCDGECIDSLAISSIPEVVGSVAVDNGGEASGPEYETVINYRVKMAIPHIPSPVWAWVRAVKDDERVRLVWPRVGGRDFHHACLGGVWPGSKILQFSDESFVFVVAPSGTRALEAPPVREWHFVHLL